MLRILKYLAGAVILVIAALLLGAVPFPASSDHAGSAKDRVTIYVLSNGFHSDIAVPRLDGQTFEQLGLSEQDYPVQIDHVKYWAFGWGSKTAYTSLLAVSDLTVGIAAKALAFDETVMHITPLGDLKAGENIFAFEISKSQYQALLKNMARFFASKNPLDVTQGVGDRFYAGNGRFAPWLSCNTWTGRRLREIGIGVGLWTPTSQALEFGLHAVASKS
ncbi:hypothetical protein SU32_15125 [Ahrensia marina]|uniref:Urease-associated protein n=1 Tax=Ahrensia marina TaxID=1514904 RepID=A0A0N0E6L0_9HYPH|nr:hypothetical protein SU32_15125 [Ahrensia marina]